MFFSSSINIISVVLTVVCGYKSGWVNKQAKHTGATIKAPLGSTSKKMYN